MEQMRVVPMDKVCLDFDTALDFLRGDPRTLDKMRYYADREEMCITSFTMLHITEVINKPEVVAAFANGVTVLPFDRKAAQMAATINRELQDKGNSGKRNEIVLTAAICIVNDASLFAQKPSDFDGIKGLKKV
jgi:predicted nucleic acid-binding protein